MAEHRGPINSETFHLLWRARDREATPAEAAALLATFVDQVDAGGVAPELFAYVVDCLRSYLAWAHCPPEVREALAESHMLSREARRLLEAPRIASLDQAFGLTRGERGRPRARAGVLDVDGLDVAATVLHFVLQGRSVREGCAAVIEDRDRAGLTPNGDTWVNEQWVAYKWRAETLACLRERYREGGETYEWTPEEFERLRGFYADAPGKVFPDETPFADLFEPWRHGVVVARPTK
jgi:hypothetical protein